MGEIGKTTAYSPDEEDGPEISVELGGDDPATADHYAPAGDDSPPLEDDLAVLVEITEATDTYAAVAYTDETPRVAEPGEVRRYARDSSGEVVSSIHLKGDKTVEIAQANGASVVIASDGEITITGPAGTVTMGTDGSISLEGGVGTIAIDAAGAISLDGISVSLNVGEALGSFLLTLHTAMVAWVPVPGTIPGSGDGGTALKVALAAWFTQVPPGP